MVYNKDGLQQGWFTTRMVYHKKVLIKESFTDRITTRKITNRFTTKWFTTRTVNHKNGLPQDWLTTIMVCHKIG